MIPTTMTHCTSSRLVGGVCLAVLLLTGTSVAAEGGPLPRLRLAQPGAHGAVAMEGGRPRFHIPADSPLARDEHPRLLLTKADLLLVKRRAADPRMARYVEAMKRRSEGQYPSNLERALLYRLTGEKRYLTSILESPDFARPTWIYEWAATIDLIWDDLPEPRRRALSDAVIKAVAQDGALYWRPTLHLASVFYEGGKGPNDAALLARMSRDFDETLLRWTDKLNRWAAGRGGSDMSHGYNGEHAYWEPFIAAICWTNATGQDYVARADFTRYQSAFYWYHFLPNLTPLTVEKIGVTRTTHDRSATSPGHSGANNLLYLTFTREDDGLGLAWMTRFHQQDPAWRPDGDAVGRLLWWDPDQEPLDPGTLPTTRLFPTSGHVVMRSDWTPKATFATFRCGRFGEIDGHWGRNNADNLSFTIRKAGPLAIDSGPVHSQNITVLGFCGMAAVRDYGRQTIAHNSITLGDGEFAHVDWQGRPTGDVLRRGGQSVAQAKEWWAQWGFKAPQQDFQEGRVTGYRTHPLYDYALGEARFSYPPKVVKEITRQFLYLKPDTFVIYDRIAVADPADRPCWLLHSLREPKASGGETALATEGIGPQFVMTDAGKRPHPDPGGHFRMSGDGFRIESGSPGRKGDGWLAAHTLWPPADEAERRKIGGRGHDFEVAGIQYGLADAGYAKADDPYSVLSTIGLLGWRVELRHRTPAEVVEFLHVAQVGVGTGGQATPALRSSSEAHTVTFEQGGRRFEVALRRTGPRGGKVRVTDTDEGTVLHEAALPDQVEDHWRHYKDSLNYPAWMTDPRYRAAISPTSADKALLPPK